MQIAVRTITDKTIVIKDIEPTDTIGVLKAKIQDKDSNHPRDRLRLIYACKYLQDDHTLTQCRIMEGSHLHVVLNLHMNITIETMNRTTFHLDIKFTDTIGTLKAKIQEMYPRYPIGNQVLIFANQRLENNRTFGSYGIYNGDKIEFRCCMRITAEIVTNESNESIDIAEIEIHDSIRTLKSKIRAKNPNIPLDEMFLIYADKYLQDSRTLALYGIHEGDNIIFRLSIKITVKTLTNKIIGIEGIRLRDTIGTLNAKIYDKDSETSLDQMRLSYNNRLLGDHHTLVDYDIHQGATVDVVERLGIMIMILTFNGKSFDLHFKHTETVKTLKEKYQDREGAPRYGQQFIFRGKALNDDDQTLAFYGVKEGSQIHVVYRLTG